jgi:hypothetical protein
MRIRWLVRTVESKCYLREYNEVGVGAAVTVHEFTVYISKLNTLHRIMSLQ